MTLIKKTHTDGSTESSAIYSPCERYRYALTRVWDKGNARLLYVMLNPSTATEMANDPTIERCERRARQLGYGAFRITNIFAWRETDPRLLMKAEEPTGPENAKALFQAAEWTDTILCAWGVHGAKRDQGRVAARLLRNSGKPLFALGTTKDGHPRHPLYVSYKTQPEGWAGYNS